MSRIEEYRKNGHLKDVTLKKLDKKYKILEKGWLSVSTMLKNKIQAGSTKISSYEDRMKQQRHNQLFQSNQSQLYKELSGSTSQGNPPPDADESVQFWSNIWSTSKEHNREAVWLDEVRKHFRGKKEQADIVLTKDNVVRRIKKGANWKAAGPDGVRGYWFKYFSSLHSSLASALQKCLDQGNVPEWMVKGRTVLIQKDPAKGTAASNYRPIACLPLMWKLLTGIFADKIYDHLLKNNILPYEQKGCIKGARGTKDQLMIDKMVLKEVKKFQKNVSIAYIDYKKAYDMVPHSWILEMVKMVGVAKNVGSLIRSSMRSWCTELSSGGNNLGRVNIKRGIFQGDSLSPLLFVIVMIPLTVLLRKEKLGYRFTKDNSGNFLNHLLFMDDLKLYGKDEEQLERLVDLVENFSQDIGMEFGLEKCGMLTVQRGVKIKSEGIELPDGKLIQEIDDNGYKYLGILQCDGTMEREMKERVQDEYYRRLRLLLKSKLNGGNLIKGINAWAVSIVRYSAGVVSWTKKELKLMDKKTRFKLTMAGAFHMKSSVDRLYIKRANGGRGLISVEDCVRQEEGSLVCYAKRSKEWMLKAVASTMESREDGPVYKKRVQVERQKRLGEKNLHGKVLKEMKQIGTDRNWQWVRRGRLSKSVEGFMFAAQEQTLRTRWKRAKIEGENISDRCRVCGKEMETVMHLVAGCEVLSKGCYKRRHDKMGLRVYWEMCRKNGIRCTEKWYDEIPDPVRISEDGKKEIWWDRKLQTSQKMDHIRPDIVLFNREKKGGCTIVDFSVPWDKNVQKKEQEKVDSYVPLAKDITRVQKMSAKVIPIVVGGMGTVSPNLVGHLKGLGIPDVVECLQSTAIVATYNILTKVLNLETH